jgi:hypothetical protein
MLARRSSLPHPITGEVDLPLLVPAFSSKGFGLRGTRRNGHRLEYTPLVYELSDFARSESTAVLVSAYDLHFGHFNAPEFPDYEPQDYLRNAQLVFMDSGGYELVPDFDSTEPRNFPHQIKPGYESEEYAAVLERYTSLEDPLPLVVANFDYGSRRKPLHEQIEEARALFHRFHRCTTNFIIKPWTKSGEVVDPRDLSPTALADLRGFDIIGVTEKELGRNVFDRLKGIAALRKGLDEAENTAPIHVWGGLDPIMTPLFFFAGAQIFDGVSWLRYAFKNGVAMNRECHSVLNEDMGITASRTLNRADASVKNRRFLDNLSIYLQQWADYDGTRFDMFHPNVREDLERAYEVMVSQIPALRSV